jgi:hypothetical protein
MRTLAIGAALALALVHPAGGAPDIAGRWRAEVPAPGGETAFEYLDLTVRNTTVTGTLTNALGGVGQIHDGVWDGSTLRFWVPWDPGKLEARGSAVGDTLELVFKTSRWQAKRVFRRPPASSR